MNSILIVGCGNMGGAMLAGWLAAGFDPARFTVVDPVLETAPAGVTLLREMPQGRFDALLLGIKPQMLGELASRIEPLAGPETTVLSILAGVELATLAERFPRSRAVVRVMPNLAAALGSSPVALAGAGIELALQAEISALMRPLGSPEWFADDAQFDLITALVGSGPAFVYTFIDALTIGANELGMGLGQAQRLALAMVEGAVRLAMQSPDSPAELARKVTSPGGTTAAGLAVLDAELAWLVEATLSAARDRGAELAREAR